MNEIKNKKVVLEELRLALDKTISAGHTLNDKIQNILSFSSIIVSVVAAIEASVFQNKVGLGFWAMVVIALSLYLVSVWLIFRRGLHPIEYRTPISIDWDELANRYFHVEEEAVFDLTINEYLCSLDDISKSNTKKAKIVRSTSLLMIWMIIFLLLAIPVGIIFS